MVGTKKKLPLELSIYIPYLYQDKNVPIQTIVNSYRQYSQATIYRHVKKPIITELVDNNRASNLGGRPKKLIQGIPVNLLEACMLSEDWMVHLHQNVCN